MHEGHRQRLKKRFIEEGLDGFEPHQILELLLFFTIPRKDTNELAHSLISKYGSLSGVFEADPADLVKTSGIGNSSALLLSLIPALSRLYFKDKWGQKVVLDSSKKAGEYMVSLFAGVKNEIFYVVCLDSQNRVNYSAAVHEGTIDTAPVYPRIIVETALRHQAVSVILAHNHPGGRMEPSRADMDATSRIKAAMEPLSINVIDHIIVAGDKYLSFADRGII